MGYKIGVDVDGVLRNDVEKCMEIFRRIHPEAVKSDIVHGWDFPNVDITFERKLEILFTEYPLEIFEGSEPFENAIEGFNLLNNWLYENNGKIACVTHQQPELIHHTLIWLGKHKFNFPEIKVTGEKQKTDIDFLIDDAPHNFKNWVDAGRDPKRFILVDRDYNKDVPAPSRVSSVGESISIIESELKKESWLKEINISTKND